MRATALVWLCIIQGALSMDSGACGTGAAKKILMDVRDTLKELKGGLKDKTKCAADPAGQKSSVQTPEKSGKIEKSDEEGDAVEEKLEKPEKVDKVVKSETPSCSKEASPIENPPPTMSKGEIADRCANFEPVIGKNVNMNISCLLSSRDLEKGLSFEDLMEKKLCTNYFMMLPIRFDTLNEETVSEQEIVDVNNYDGKNNFNLVGYTFFNNTTICVLVSLLKKWRDKGVQLLLQIGGGWNDPKRNSPASIANLLDPKKPFRKVFLEKLVKIFSKNIHHGLLMSWYYPSCQNLTKCPAENPAYERDSLTYFFIDFKKSILKDEKITPKLVALEMITRFGKTLYDIQKLYSCTDIFLMQTSCPEMRAYNKYHDDSTTNFKSSSVSHMFSKDPKLELNEATGLRSINVPLGSYVFLEMETIFKVLSFPSNLPANNAYHSIFKLISSQVKNLSNITSKNLCLLFSEKNVLPENGYLISGAFQDLVPRGSDLYPKNEYAFMKAQLTFFAKTLYEITELIQKAFYQIIYFSKAPKLSGFWIRDIWADDVNNECGCGSFPILRAANEAIGRSNCKLSTCPNLDGRSRLNKQVGQSSKSVAPIVPLPVKKKIVCIYTNEDYIRGLSAEKVVDSKLCDVIFASIDHIVTTYSNEVMDFPSITPLNLNDAENDGKWKGLGIKRLYHLGSWKMELTPASLAYQIKSASFASYLVNMTVDYIRQNKFSGVHLSWSEPAVPAPVDYCYKDCNYAGYLLPFLQKLNAEFVRQEMDKAVIVLEMQLHSTYTHIKSIMSLVDHIFLVRNFPDRRLADVMKYDRKIFDDMEDYVPRYYALSGGTGYYVDTDLSTPAGENVMLPELQTFALQITQAGVVDIPSHPEFVKKWEIGELTFVQACRVLNQKGVVVKPDLKVTTSMPSAQINDTSFLFYNDYADIVKKVAHFTANLKYRGVVVRDLWADDFNNECGCGSFPTLRAANEAIGRSSCKLSNCPTIPNT